MKTESREYVGIFVDDEFKRLEGPWSVHDARRFEIGFIEGVRAANVRADAITFLFSGDRAEYEEWASVEPKGAVAVEAFRAAVAEREERRRECSICRQVHGAEVEHVAE